MSCILIIGAGAAGSVVTKKCVNNSKIFTDIHVASRTYEKCKKLKKECQNAISIYELDADNINATIKLIHKIKPKLVINMALPYQDLPIMDACIATKTNYMDTANYEPKETAKFCYKWQWDYHEKFKQNNIIALLGSGFDPGVTNVFVKYAAQTIFDTIETVDIIDCNAGNHGHPFATNFNPEINIREITQDAKLYENGQWITLPAMSKSKEIFFPEVGKKKAYLLYHEELESLQKFFPSIKRLRFWMTFSESYLNHLNVLENIGLTSIKPIQFQNTEIVPLEFLKELLPNPNELSENYTGKTCIGCVITGKINNKKETKIIYNICNHEACHKELNAQAVSYTTGVPAMIGAKMLLTKTWTGKGVFNMEQFDALPFMNELNLHGLPWKIQSTNELD